jgi:hypothetical protein
MTKGLILIFLGLATWRVAAVDALDQWSTAYSTSNELWAVTFTSGLFIAGGENGVMLTSPDGWNWMAAKTATKSRIRSITSNGFGNFLAATDGPLLQSDDAKTWVTVPVKLYDSHENATNWLVGIEAVAFAGSTFIFGGSACSFCAPEIFTSTDWYAGVGLEPAAPSAQGFGSYSVITPGKSGTNEYLVAAGSIFEPLLLGTPLTVNGRATWRFNKAQGPYAGYATPSEYVEAGAFGNSLFVLVGMEGPTLVSTNYGDSWKTVLTGNPPPNVVPSGSDYLNQSVGTGLAFGNGTFAACTDHPNHILTSTNGVWTEHLLPFPLPTKPFERYEYGLNAITYGLGRFVAVGADIVVSGDVSIPMISVDTEASSGAFLRVSGEIGRAYVLENSPDLVAWNEALSYTNTAPLQIIPVDQSSPSVFYRVKRGR